MTPPTPNIRRHRSRYLRFLWSHDSGVHRRVVRVANQLLALVPMRINYAVGAWLRRKRPPYALLRAGDVAVQVGAPHDTLRSGRSRAFYFGVFVGPAGRVVAVEPDAISADALRKASAAHGHDNITVVERAAWSCDTTLRIYIDDRHPAANFTAGSKSYDGRRMASYRHVDLPAATLDQMARELNLATPVTLVSITTNGADREILAGMSELIARGVSYIAIADTGVVRDSDMAALGYRLLSFDDRGRTYERVAAAPAAPLIRRSPARRLLKPLFDRSVAAAALLVALPLFALIASAVLVANGRPVFFRQQRIGRSGRPFTMWKFRTMRAGPEPQAFLTGRMDLRVTRLGRVLRKLKLDELPQLFNVLSGRMSFVGPRPEVAHYVAQYTPTQRPVLDFLPGITDPASIAYIDEESILARFDDRDRAYVERVLPDKIRLSLEYAARAGFWSDIWIILVTLGLLFSRRSRDAAPPSPTGSSM